jgi:hypothetical protein
LRPIGVLPCVGHTEKALLGVLELEVLVWELGSIDCQMLAYEQLALQGDILDFPPVPSPLVKSPPWIMKFLMTRWKVDPSYPKSFSPVAKALKFSAVLGTVLP